MKRVPVRTLAVIATVAIAISIAWVTRPIQHHNKNGFGVHVETVYAATVNIPLGTTADKVIADGMTEMRTVGQQSTPPGAPRAINSLNEIQGKVAVQTIPRGSEIPGQEFASPSPATRGSPNKPSPSR
jgi:hypothetical protein